MTQDMIKQIVQLTKAGVPAAAIPAILAGMTGTDLPKAKAKSKKFFVKGKWSADDLAVRDAQTVAAFKRKGFNVTLMDRNDPTKPYDVRPYGKQTVNDDGTVTTTGWLGQGRVVRKGQHGVNGLFHITQTDPLPDKAS